MGGTQMTPLVEGEAFRLVSKPGKWVESLRTETIPAMPA
jgi:hypothetical protein